jgi:TetR/AcrR family transcriptional repressor of mexJK operon
MVKTWSADNPKAALMARKRAAIVDAALKAFLEAGYAEASVNRIAAAAGVSIKTLYRHYESKDDLFSAVMQTACGKPPGSDSDKQDEPAPNWYALPPAEALPQAGAEYLRHVLSQDQLALYRVVVRDAHRFPELGLRYREVTTGTRGAIFTGYLDLWADREGWIVRDKQTAADVFAGLLKAGIFDEAVLGLSQPSNNEIVDQAQDAAQNMLLLFRAARF